MTEKATHTPAPWTLSVDPETGAFEIEVAGPTRVLCRRGPWPNYKATSIANGRVMVAAPDLLVALKDLLGLWQSQDRVMTTEEIAAEYAIAKAEGTT